MPERSQSRSFDLARVPAVTGDSAIVPGLVTVLDVPLTTTNRLLRSTLPEYYSGAYGVKTGTSNRAGSNLVSAATRAEEDIIAVVLGSDPDSTATGDRFSDSRAQLRLLLN